jgi:hypothetical protein
MWGERLHFHFPGLNIPTLFIILLKIRGVLYLFAVILMQQLHSLVRLAVPFTGKRIYLKRTMLLLLSSYLVPPKSSVCLHGIAGYTQRRKTQRVMMNVPAAIGRMPQQSVPKCTVPVFIPAPCIFFWDNMIHAHLRCALYDVAQ